MSKIKEHTIDFLSIAKMKTDNFRIIQTIRRNLDGQAVDLPKKSLEQHVLIQKQLRIVLKLLEGLF